MILDLKTDILKPWKGVELPEQKANLTEENISESGSVIFHPFGIIFKVL